MPDAIVPRRLPNLESVEIDLGSVSKYREAAVTAVLVAPSVTGACGPSPTTGGSDVHPFDCQVLLIERAQGGVYGGQLALPGGKMEPGESPEETAIRELHEELGVHVNDPRHKIELVGHLDPAYSPASGFLIHVMVAVAPTIPLLRPDPTEVVSTVGVALGVFDPSLPVHETEGTHGGERLRYGAYPAPGGRIVWGLTARLLCELAGRVAEG
ncbi:MAG: NUDIX hydrolase, partial [Candidatus Limnocylindrus sp.]